MVRSVKVQLCGINFSLREVEILAFLCNGRSHKFIANIFGVSVRTVETHARNIVIKSGAPSLEHLSDKLIQSGEMGFLYSVYTNALYADKFKGFLSEIVGESRVQRICLVSEFCDCSDVSRIRDFLSMIGCEVVSSSSVVPGGSYSSVYVRIRKHDVDISRFDSVIDVVEYGVYLALLRYLRVIVRNTDVVDKQIELYHLITNTSGRVVVNGNSECSNWREVVKRGYKTGVAAGAALIGFACLLNGIYPRSDEVITNRDLFVVSDVMLQRSTLMNSIKQALSDERPINVVSLVGVGGAGKTKLAGMYMHSCERGVAYQLNAETTESLYKSFGDLADQLATSDILKDELKVIMADSDQDRRYGKLLTFVRTLLRKQKWLLVYDNVDDVRLIHKSFPNNAEWGSGSVIITTRDENIVYNLGVGNSKVIKLSELSKDEQVELFNMVSKRLKNKIYERSDVLRLMKLVPAYPLDVSMVACCIAGSGMSVDDYIEKLRVEFAAFDSIDESLMTDSTEYGKTRYGIIVTTLNRIMNEIKSDRALRGMLLLLSMCDSQNIPVEMFKRYGDAASEMKFLTILKKYSFIDQNADEVSIHRTVQDMWLRILSKKMDGGEIDGILNSLVSKVINFEDVTYDYREVNEFVYKKSFYDSMVEHEKKIIECTDKLDCLTVDQKAKIKAHLLAICATTLLGTSGSFQEIADMYNTALALDSEFSIFGDYDRVMLLRGEGYARSFFDADSSVVLVDRATQLLGRMKDAIPLRIACLVDDCRVRMLQNDYDGGMRALDEAFSLIPDGSELWKRLAFAQVKYFQDGYNLENHFNNRKLGEYAANSFMELMQSLGCRDWDSSIRMAKGGELVALVPILAFEVLRGYNDACMYDKAKEYFKHCIKFLEACGDFKCEVWAKSLYGMTLLRTGCLGDDVGDFLLKTYAQLEAMEDNFSLMEAAANLSEFYVRRGEYAKAVQMAGLHCNSNGTLQRQLFSRYLMNFAIAAHSLNDDVEAYEYYRKFLGHIKIVCSVCLSKEDFAKLNEAGAFEPISGSSIDMKACLENARRIFTVIFGEDHAMITEYLNRLSF